MKFLLVRYYKFKITEIAIESFFACLLEKKTIINDAIKLLIFPT